MNNSLTALAESINEARITANQHEATAPQNGVYGKLSDALHDTLALILGERGSSLDAYQNILDGCPVALAITDQFRASATHPDTIIGYIDPADNGDGTMIAAANWEPGHVFHGQPIPDNYTPVRNRDLDGFRVTI